MNKHTAGPWAATTLGTIRDGRDLTIAKVVLHKTLHLNEYERKAINDRFTANAILIAAAPDLLECVRGFVESWGKEVDNDIDIQGSDAVDWISGAMFEFQVALAKATAA